MFKDVEEAIVSALQETFKKKGETIPGGIARAIGKDNLKSPPLRFPAIRVLFAECSPREAYDLGAQMYVADATFQVVIFMANLSNLTDHIYSLLNTVVESLKNLQTSRGKLKPGKIFLGRADNILAYVVNFHLEVAI
ncbi:MAG: hypothetical protein ABGX12_06600 [Desulfurobacteriaceae bacterium]